MDMSSLHTTLHNLLNVRKGRASYKVIKKRIIEGATIDGIHLCQLMAAMIIASIGLNIDSTEAVIGAMLICPLMGSVLALAYSMATLDMKELRSALLGLATQVVVCLLTSTFYFVLSPLSNTTSELLTNSMATVWDVCIAFVGGFAGALGLSRKQEPSTLIAGVAVATALMPPLCTTGYGLAMRDLSLAAAAFYEFLINVIFIAFGSELVWVWLKVPLQSDLNGDGVVTEAEAAEAQERSTKLRHRLVICSLIFAVPCLFFSYNVILSTMTNNGTLFEVRDSYDTEYTTLELNAICPAFTAYRIGTEDSYDTETDQLQTRLIATVVTSETLSEEAKSQIEKLIRLNVDNLDEVDFEVRAT